MNFEIKRIITNEYNSGDYQIVDLDDLEDFIKSRLDNKNYGESVTKFFWGFELFKFCGGFAQFFKNDITSWKHSTNYLVSNSHFDWDTINDLSKSDTLKLIKTELLSSVDRIGYMKKKPKNFDYKQLRIDLGLIIDEYIVTNNTA